MRVPKYSKPLTISVTPAVYEILKQQSDAVSISIAERVRDIIDSVLENDTETNNK